jgi:hypothetical protein
MTKTTFELIDDEVAAFNERDIEAFVATFAADATLAGPRGADGTIAGHEGIREHFGRQMAREGRRVEILSRVALGSWVIDHEIVYEDDGTLEQIAAYQVRDGLIAHVDVLRPIEAG